MNPLPHADELGHDLIAAAEHLALLNWTAPAALTARVALERALRDTVAAAGYKRRTSERAAMSDIAALIASFGVLSNPERRQLTRTAASLSKAAHGRSVLLQDAVLQIEHAKALVGRLQQVQRQLDSGLITLPGEEVPCAQ